MLINKTKSMCPECLKVIDAEIIERENVLYLRKECREHGKFEARHIFDVLRLYWEMHRIFIQSNRQLKVYPHDLIIYVNSECNQNCALCYSKANEKKIKEPSIQEILARIKNFQGRYVHLCGGEPTLRSDLLEIIKQIKKSGFKVGLFSNGKKLLDKNYVYSLRNAGVELVTLQFDTLNDEHYKVIRRESLIDMKLQVIRNLKDADIYIYLFCVLADGINNDQVSRLTRFSLDNSDIVKIINFNTIWQVGRFKDFLPMPKSKIYEEVTKQIGVSLDDFIVGTEFSYYLFESYRKLMNKKWIMHNPCVQRCYMFKINNQLVPITRIFDLKRINICLNEISNKLIENSKIKNWITFLSLFPYFLIVKGMIRPKMLSWLLKEIGQISFKIINKKRMPRLGDLNVFSLMVASGHDIYNIDLGITSKCTMYADIIEKNTRSAACIRQIFYNKYVECEK